MSTDDPFASPEPDHTFIMPSPGQRPRAGTQTSGQARAGAGYETPVSIEALIPGNGLNPIVIAASPLLNAVPPLRASLAHPDPTALRETLAQGVRAFEAKARASGVEAQKVIAARYVLCTFIDETAASTPWGGSGVWGRHSLLVLFHNEASGGEKVFQLMAKLAENPAANRDLLELLYVILALGFEGRYRVLENGHTQLLKLRERLFGMLRQQRGDYERELSPHWTGIETKRRPLAFMPMWVGFALAAIGALGLYLLLSFNLNRKSDPVFSEILALRSAPPVPVPVQAGTPPPLPRLAGLLAPEIKSGKVAVADFGDRSIVTIRGDGLFQPGSINVSEELLPLFQRIGEALNTLPGPILITGHTDSQPIRSARFPSNWHLSQERATAVQVLLSEFVERGRLRAEGHADSEPVADNSTAANRAKNRRVEITLFSSQNLN